MNIVVLDAYTCNPGDLSWDGLRALGPCDIYDRTPRDQVVPRARNAEIVLTNKTVLDRDALASLPELRYIGVLATGYNIVDVAAARQRGVVVANVPEYGTPTVAQAAFALLLELTNHVGHHAQTVREGRWSASPDFCYWDYPLIELASLTMGVVGLGRIGRAVAQIARAFGMTVLGYDRYAPRVAPDEVRLVDLDQLFRQSDVVTLHCPLTEENRGLVHAGRLALMKPSAFLLNTARGGLVVDEDLACALNEGRLAGAGLDVLSVEPPPPDNPLVVARNCLITPHIAWATRAARARLIHTAVENIRAFLRGQPVNVVT
ncbi:MAG: D-2-hydroxyacid dehydrogenase [Thermoguttaceae bacterium]|jgi:glycerate dehydrogenase|nr:D-2-hydroxyacid dehydrogenase [Thermoguttaceae bacterium]